MAVAAAPSRLPELIQDWIRLSRDVLAQAGIKDADQLAESVVRALVDEYGGQQYYLPANWHRRAEKARKLYAEFDGRNLDDLVRRYKLSRPTAYRLINLGRRLELLDRQGDLFGAVDPAG